MGSNWTFAFHSHFQKLPVCVNKGFTEAFIGTLFKILMAGGSLES